tara:strand:- start:11 stop:442 length:432 start_codon:yes stop_codon:yes gene_type:complete
MKGDFTIADDIPPLIPEATYTVMLDHFVTCYMFSKAKKLVLNFSITSYGKHYGLKLPRYYNVMKIIGRPCKNGRFQVSKKCDFMREFYTLFENPAKRLDRIPMSLFKGVEFEARVKTVREARGKKIPKPLQYSKIDELMRVVR